MHDYKKLDVLGEGTYGTVYLAEHKKSKKKYAIKKLNPSLSSSDKHEGVSDSCLVEFNILKHFHHENIVKSFGTFNFTGKWFIVLEYMDSDLRDLLNKETLSDHEKQSITKQLLNGVAYLHSHSIIHQDLKPQNILISQVTTNRNRNFKLAICDFGLAKIIIRANEEVGSDICTRWYRPPELFLNEDGHSFNVDSWSVGCIIYEILFNEVLIKGDDEEDQLYKIFKVCGTPTNTTWPGVEELHGYKKEFPVWIGSISSTELPSMYNNVVRGCLTPDPNQRMTIKEAREVFGKEMSYDFNEGTFYDFDMDFDEEYPRLVNSNPLCNRLGIKDLGSTIDPSYITSKKEINSVMRHLLFDWLSEVATTYKLLLRTYLLSVAIVDSFLSKNDITRKNLQLLGITALSIASKYIEIYAPEVNEFVYISDNTYKFEEVIEMETCVLTCIDFNLVYYSHLIYTSYYCRSSKKKENTPLGFICMYLCEVTPSNYNLLKYSNNVIGGACSIIALQIVEEDDLITEIENTFKKSGDYENLVSCVIDIKIFLKRQKVCKYKAIYKKYKSERYSLVSDLVHYFLN